MSKSLRKPSLLFHKSTGQARVRIDGRDHYLGKYGSPETQARYDLLVSDWLRNKSIDRSTLTVDELALRFLDHAESYYRNDGRPSGEAYNVRVALRPLVRIFGQSLVTEFGPLKLKAVREAMIETRWKRTSINRNVQRIKAAFRWGVENEIVPAGVYHALQAVRGLSRGRSAAVESQPVLPVPRAFVEAIRPHVSRHVWAMIELQLLTGARPGEIVSMRTREVNTSGKIWEYSPSTHKSQYRGHGRVIMIGPKGQEVLRQFLRPDLESFVFSPVDAEAERNARRREQRQTPMTRSQAARHPKENGRRRPKDHYTPNTYRQAIVRACAAAGVPPWHPHQIRHSRATDLRRQFGIEAARVTMGHASLDATEIYAEADVERARQIAFEVG